VTPQAGALECRQYPGLVSTCRVAVARTGGCLQVLEHALLASTAQIRRRDPPNGQRPSRAVSRAPPVPHARPAARSQPRHGGHGLLTVVVPLAEQVLQAAHGVVVIEIQHQSFLATTTCINANRDPSPRAVETFDSLRSDRPCRLHLLPGGVIAPTQLDLPEEPGQHERNQHNRDGGHEHRAQRRDERGDHRPAYRMR
jgi:hypothetical protein